MSRKDLRELAAQFKSGEPDQAPPEPESSDLTGEIERRLAAAKRGRSSDPASDELITPTESKPQAAPEVGGRPRESRSSRSVPSRGSITPALRDTEPRQRVPVDVPANFEQLRLAAKAQGISATTLVLTTLRAERAELEARAKHEGIAPIVAQGFKRWTLLMSDHELAELDGFTTAMERALGRRSRAKAIALVLHAHTAR